MAGIGKQANKPAHKRYQAENRRLTHKRERVLASSHGRWTYEMLVAHQREKQAAYARQFEQALRAAIAARVRRGERLDGRQLLDLEGEIRAQLREQREIRRRSLRKEGTARREVA